jgi:hypothetical protein
LFCILLQNAFGQINPEWHQEDMNLIDSVTNLDKNNPKEVESFFHNHAKTSHKKNLGFGWAALEQIIGAGYISISANFFYFNDTIQSYILTAKLPDEKQLIREYKDRYSKFLPSKKDAFFMYKYKEQNILHPLKEFALKNTKSNLPRLISEYMSPTSGDMYGYAGGLALTVLPNRKLFNEIKDSVTPSQIITIMYSINPVSRLTAIEYYVKNKKKFKQNNDIDKWIEKVYNEVPTIETISGCIVSEENSKQLVEELAKLKLD